MAKSSHALKVRATGLTPIQSAAKKHFMQNPDGASFPVRMIDATHFQKTVFSFIASLTRPVLDQPYRATFQNVRDWNDCVEWQGEVTLDGYASSSAVRRIWEFFTGTTVPEGAQISHVCHDKTTCSAGIMCSHRACMNPLHWYLTTPKGTNSRSHNAPKRAKLTKRKMAAHKLTWTVCSHGHETVPGKECARCNAIAQENFRIKAREVRAMYEAQEEAIRNGELFAALVTPTALELAKR